MNIPDAKKVHDFTRLLELAKAMSVEKDLYALLDLIVQRTTEVMEADRTSLYLVDADKQQLWTRIAQGLEIKEVRVPIGTGISGHVAKTRETVNIQDAYLDPRFDRGWDMKTGYRTRSILCMPLLTHEDRVVGVIQVLNKKGGAFTDYDESLLAALGSHAAIALDQARLMQHYVEKQRMQEALRIARDIQMSLL
ncbi:MAG: GAF domain-containing protein, partial [Planctomycetes bacterium]|nr:GAF domain-containing protein [Planctomycetota bacterium]